MSQDRPDPSPYPLPQGEGGTRDPSREPLPQGGVGTTLPPPSTLGPQHQLIWVLLGLAVFCLIGGAALRKYTQHAERLDVLGRVDKFQFTDQRGERLRSADLRGKVWIASFIFTRCAGTCIAITDSLSNLNRELRDQNDIRFFSFSMDPVYDTPEVLAQYAKAHNAEAERWQFLTGPKDAMHGVSVNQFKLGVDEAGTDPKEPIIHSEKLVLVDRLGRIRGYYPGTDAEAVKMLAEDARRLNNAFGVHYLPAVNATLNGIAFILLCLGMVFIKAGLQVAHRNTMVAAGIMSGLFLACYLIYHFEAGSMPFRGEGNAAIVYYAILISHVILAMVVAVIVPITFWYALAGNWEKHKRIAKVSLPLWMYVSITGVIVYFMLYHMFAPGA